MSGAVYMDWFRCSESQPGPWNLVQTLRELVDGVRTGQMSSQGWLEAETQAVVTPAAPWQLSHPPSLPTNNTRACLSHRVRWNLDQHTAGKLTQGNDLCENDVRPKVCAEPRNRKSAPLTVMSGTLQTHFSGRDCLLVRTCLGWGGIVYISVITWTINQLQVNFTHLYNVLAS